MCFRFFGWDWVGFVVEELCTNICSFANVIGIETELGWTLAAEIIVDMGAGTRIVDVDGFWSVMVVPKIKKNGLDKWNYFDDID